MANYKFIFLFLASFPLVGANEVESKTNSGNESEETATVEHAETEIQNTNRSHGNSIWLYMKPFYMDEVPLSKLISQFKGGQKEFEKEFASSLSEQVPSLNPDEIFINSIINPSKTLLDRTRGVLDTTRLFFHDVIFRVMSLKLRHFRRKNEKSEVPDNEDENQMIEEFMEFEKKKERKGLTRIEYFITDMKSRGIELMKKIVADVERLLSDINSSFWKNTIFGKRIAAILEKPLVISPKLPLTKIKLPLKDFKILRTQKSTDEQEESDQAQTGTSTEEPPCYEEDVDYPENDIRKIEDGTLRWAHECQQECLNTENCKYFTFNSSLGWCYLKTGEAANSRKKDNETRYLVSGMKICPALEQLYPDTPCNLEGVDLFGNDVETTNEMSSLSSCAFACKVKPTCYYYTFDSTKNLCFLKNNEAISGYTQNENTSQLVSGAKRCPIE